MSGGQFPLDNGQALCEMFHADRVVVLDAGRIEEQGSHAELLAAGGLYARIFRAQARLESPEASSTAVERERR